jgi:hypothetical protein
MFVDAIEKVAGFTRPIHTILREYGNNTVIPGAATLFFVNESGQAITCKHVVALIVQANKINQSYKAFKKEEESLTGKGGKYNRKLRELKAKYKYHDGKIIQVKNNFVNCINKITDFEIILHPTEDVALIKFNGFDKLSYSSYATFLKDSSLIKQGKCLCRLGYPFPEFTNFKYNEKIDDIEWTSEGKEGTPRFPIDGMITRQLVNKDGIVHGIEMSTPGLRGQSGAPLFDENAIVYGMQSKTHHLHLGFDIKDKEIREGVKIKKISNYPFLHLGNCVHVDIIKSFLKQHNIKFYESL